MVTRLEAYTIRTFSNLLHKKIYRSPFQMSQQDLLKAKNLKLIELQTSSDERYMQRIDREHKLEKVKKHSERKLRHQKHDMPWFNNPNK